METLIALVVLSLMLVILFSGLRMGAGSWDAAQNRVETSTEWAIAARFLQQRLSYALQVDWHESEGGQSGLAFIGEQERVGFVSTLPAHVGGGGLRWVELEIGRTDRGRGLLLRHSLFHPDTFDGGEPRRRDTELLLEGVQSLTVRYYGRSGDEDSYRWHDQWGGEDMPHLIALLLTRDDGRELVLASRSGHRPADTGPLFPWEVR